MRKKLAPKVLAGLTTALLICAVCVLPALASTPVDANGKATIPVYLTQAATTIDVTIGTGTTPEAGQPTAEAIYMNAAANSNDATVTNLVVKNNNVSAPVFVTGVEINNMRDGYTMNPFSSNFETFQADSKKIGLKMTGGTDALTASNHDLVAPYTSNGDSVAADSSLSYSLSGKTAVTTAAVTNKQVADCVISLSMTAVAP